jgi:DNA-binding LacI/PurR family transcriptional regulator
LISLRHKNIGFIGVTPTSGVGLRRYHGYLEAMREHGLKADERLIVGRADDGDQWPGYSTESMGYEGMKRLLSLRKRPTAVFARNDFTAVGAMSAAKEAGLRIPQDLALVGYDDVPLAAHTTPPLTTVRQPTREQGRIAAEALVRRIESAETPAREERVMPCELIVRASTVGD